jgi:hypothetical protein
MDNESYFRSITAEVDSLKNRIRNFVQHWPTDGEWKESVLRSILRRHLSKTIGVGKGFVVGENRVSTQQDILFYDTSKPILYQEGDLLILTPDAALGAIEVKTNPSQTQMREALIKLADTAELISHVLRKTPTFFGLFAYEGALDTDTTLMDVQAAVRKNEWRMINCLSVGSSFFIRYWEHDPTATTSRLYKRWHSYDLPDKSPAYFIFNVVEHLCPTSVLGVDELWFPKEGKEPRKTGEISL